VLIVLDYLAYTKVKVFVDVIIITFTVFSFSLVVHVSNICIAFKLIPSKFVFTIVCKASCIFPDVCLFKLDFVLDANLAQANQHNADAFAKTVFKFVWRHV
jgi:hypothetical protein